LLVVIAIIGVLVSLLLPAVSKVREAANRAQCQNNLKQLGVALNNYHSTNGCFPPSWLTIGGVGSAWTVRTLPYIEQENLAKLYNFSLAWSDKDSQQVHVVTTKLALLTCPSAPSKRNTTAAAMTDYASTNLAYDANIGILPGFTAKEQYSNEGVLAHAPVGTDTSGNRVADILDGTSNTIMLAECAGRPQAWVRGEQEDAQQYGFVGTNFQGAWAAEGGAEIIVQGYDPQSKTRGKVPSPPCAINCTNGGEVYSFHPGGANVVLADGSVHFLKATTDLMTLRYLISIRDRHPVNPDW
jgi:prepilin-type processing-associated H-X9-DG protein